MMRFLNPLTYLNGLRKLYDYCIELSHHPKAPAYLAILTFIDSIFFPIPQDVMLVPMMVAQPKKSFYFATICLVSSIAGALLAYFIGLLFFDTVAMAIIEFYNYHDKMDEFKIIYQEYSWQAVIIGAISPIPFKLVTLMSGFFKVNLAIFLISGIAGRMVRFYGLAMMTYYYGERCKSFIDKYFNYITIIVTAAIIGGFAVISYI